MATTQHDEHLRIGDVASALGVSIATVREWSDQGHLVHWRTPGGQRRFRREDVERFLKTQEPAAS